MENKMETTIMGYIGIIGYMLGLYWDNGKENGNYYLGFRFGYCPPVSNSWIILIMWLYIYSP